METAEVFDRISATRIDGRCANLIYRQKILLKLFENLKQQSTELVKAVNTVYGTAPSHVYAEISQTLAAIEANYASVGALRNAQREVPADTSSQSIPAGNVLIAFDSKSTPIHNALAPLSSVIAAGDTCLLCPSHEKTKVVEILQACIKSLDRDAYVLLDTPPGAFPKTFDLSTALLQTESSQAVRDLKKIIQSSSSHTKMIECYHGPCCVIVDRTANVQIAAQQIVAAKLFNAGQAACTPHALLVHEYIQHDFLMALMAAASKADAVRLTKENFSALVEYVKAPAFSEGRRTLKGKMNASTSSMSPMIVDGIEVDAIPSLQGPLMAISPISSLDDAIDTYNQILGSRLSCASYIFASPSSAQYISQHIESVNTFVNHIPMSLLIGHVPIYGKLSLQERYSTSMFSRVSRFTQVRGLPATVPSKTAEYSELATIKKAVQQRELQRFHQREGARTDFFVQGIKVMMSTVALTTLATLAGSGFAAWKGYQKFIR